MYLFQSLCEEETCGPGSDDEDMMERRSRRRRL